jgi:3D (Asp-Asp-Asp) domain-containing protein
MRFIGVKKSIVLMLLFGAGNAAWADTPCTVSGQQGYCTPPIITDWTPSEADYIAAQRATFIAAGYLSFTVSGNTGWTYPAYGEDTLGTSRYTYLKGETAYPGGTGTYFGKFIQTREFRCLYPNGVDYIVLASWLPAGTQCFHNTPTSSQSMRITPEPKPIIPGSSRVVSKKVLTRDSLNLKVTTGSSTPAVGVAVKVQSDRAVDTISQPVSATDANGETLAKVETRDQSGPSRITSASSDTQTPSPGVVNWLPARYENKFLVTCYVISHEADFSDSPLVGNIPGLPASDKFRSRFISDVRLQGSGQSIKGDILHYDGGGRYSIQSCARTATGACAQDGTTIAVDRTVIPLRGTVAIESVGSRAAQDTGGAILGDHIDVYYGTRRAECRAAGRRSLTVDFTSY